MKQTMRIVVVAVSFFLVACSEKERSTMDSEKPSSVIALAASSVSTASLKVSATSGVATSDTLMLTASQSTIPAEYQNAISMALPGYEILRNADFLQDENELRKFLSPDEIAERKKRKSLGFIEGRFNDDSLLDFAALVINRSSKQAKPIEKPESDNWTDHFAARLVVCLSSGTHSAYHCEILPTLKGNFITLPYWADLVVFQTHGEVSCGDIDHQMATYDMPITALHPEGWNGNEDSDVVEVPARKLHPNYDAIGEYAIGVNDGRTLVRQADSVYMNCATVD